MDVRTTCTDPPLGRSLIYSMSTLAQAWVLFAAYGLKSLLRRPLKRGVDRSFVGLRPDDATYESCLGYVRNRPLSNYARRSSLVTWINPSSVRHAVLAPQNLG